MIGTRLRAAAILVFCPLSPVFCIGLLFAFISVGRPEFFLGALVFAVVLNRVIRFMSDLKMAADE